MVKRRKEMASCKFLIQLLLIPTIAHLGTRSDAVDHVVGDSIWTIPPTDEFYINWARNRTFTAGDTLLFRFETGFYNVVQVSRREFECCTGENPLRSFTEGPAAVGLNEEGVCYFICSFGNYCFLGQKVAITVHRRPPP